MSKQEVFEKLDNLGINYRAIEHEPVFCDDDIKRLVPVDENTVVVKNLFLRDSEGKKLFLLVMRYFKRADLVSLRAFLKTSKLGFCSEKRLMDNLKVTPGSVSPLCAMNDEAGKVRIIFDSCLKNYPIICMHPNDNTGSVYISFEDLVKFIQSTSHRITYFDMD